MAKKQSGKRPRADRPVGIQVGPDTEFSEVRRPGYNYMDPHAPAVHGEPKKFPEIPSDPSNTVYGEPSPEPTFDPRHPDSP